MHPGTGAKSAVFSILDTPAFGGAETYLLSHLFYLAQAGHPVFLATNCAPVREKVAVEQSHGKAPITMIELPFRLDAIGNWKGLVKFFLTAPRAAWWLLSVKKQYLNYYANVTALLPGFSERLFFSPWLKRWGFRLIWLEYGPLEPTFKRNYGFPRWLYFATKHFPDRIVTISKWTKRSIINSAKVASSDITIVYPGVETITTRQRKQYQQQGMEWRKKHNLLSTPLIVGLGRLATEKEFSVLIDAFSKLPATAVSKQSPHLVLIGEGSERVQLENQIKTLGLRSRVTITGFVNETLKQSLLATADVFVFPSAWPLEGFGMTTIEAMQWAVPVITTGFGPQSEIVSDGQTGLYFHANDSQSLANQIQKLLNDPSLAKRLGESGREKVLATFTAERMHQQLDEIM